MIPRILHYVWVGGRPLPEKSRINLETWARFCPDFEIKAWTDDNVSFEHPYLARCRALGNWANASNYLRLVKLLAHGGVYLDTDIMLRRPLTPMLRNRCFLGFQVEVQEKDWVNNAVFGAEQGHWFVELCRQRLLEEFDGSEPANFSSPRLVTRLLIERGLTAYRAGGVTVGDVHVYPQPVFYPYSWREEFTLAAIRPETTTVHFWEKSWHSDPAAAAEAPTARTALERLELKHHRLIRDAVLAVEPPRERGGRLRGLVDRLHRLVSPGARAVGRFGLVLAALCVAQPSPAPATEACGQVFDDPALRAGPVEAGGSRIRPVGCDSAAASPHYCIALPLAGGEAATPGFSVGPEAARAYRLWLRVGTSARPGKLRLALNGGPARDWLVPASREGEWQLVTQPDGKSPAAFDVHSGANTLRIDPPAEGKTAAAADCAVLSADSDFVPGLRAIHEVDRVWAGVGAQFDALADERGVYVGYYNAERHLAVAAFDRATRTWHHATLANQFEGWDNHNNIALALDSAGQLHVAGNMHATPLVYARTSQPGRVESLALVNRMVGADESRTTYPTWLTLANGELAFIYRSGSSGSGQHIIDVLTNGQWKRLGNTSLFGQQGTGFSAYPTNPLRGNDGRIHMAWAWRHGADASTTFQVAYGRSADLVHWEDAAGRTLELPLKPGSAGVVDDVPERAGLSNQVELGFDAAGRPVVSYVKFDAHGFSQLYNARPKPDGTWQVVQTSDWQDRWELEGRGSIMAQIRQEPVMPGSAGRLVQGVRHWRAGRFAFVLDPDTLRPVATQPAKRPLPEALMRPVTAEPGYFVLAIPAREEKGPAGAPPRFIVRWEAQPTERDEKPACTPQRPRACNPPPSVLTVLERR